MLFVDGGLGLVMFGVWLFCLFDVITSDQTSVRNLPKLVWLAIVLRLFDVGSIAWLIAGRSWGARVSAARPQSGSGAFPAAQHLPAHERPGRFAPTNPDDDEEFLRQVRRRAEQQRADYKRNHPDGSPEL
jgi:hypothetical protein